MKHRRMIVFIYLLLSVAAYVLFAHWMWDGGTLGMLDPAEAGVLLLLYYLLTASILTVILLWARRLSRSPKEDVRIIAELEAEIEHERQYLRQVRAQKDKETLPAYVHIHQTYCADPYLNALLILKQAQAEEKGVKLEISGGLRQGTRISCDDLTSLFSNLLDNALRAAADAETKVISMQIHQSGNMLSLSIANHFHAQHGERDWRHGFGSLIVQEIAERYDGWVRREVQDGRYIVQVTLLLEGEHDDD